MAENSKIEWTHHTFNPWIGCQKVGPGCDHCYAETWDARGLQQRETRWGPHAARTRTSAANWRKPLKWDREAATAGERRRVFCASLADVFDNHPSVLPEWRGDLWELIARTPNLDWMLLTKRPGNIANMLPVPFRLYPNVWLGCTVVNQAEADRDIPKLLAVPAAVRFLSMEPLLGPVDLRAHVAKGWAIKSRRRTWDEFEWWDWVPGRVRKQIEDFWAVEWGRGPDAWLQSSVKNGFPAPGTYGEYRLCTTEQSMVSGRIIHAWNNIGRVIDDSGAVHVVSGGAYLPRTPGLDLVIVGGESGPGARPMHPDWARSLRDQCNAAGVAFHFKQWGEWAPRRAAVQQDLLDARKSLIIKPDGGITSGLMAYGPDAWVVDRIGKKAAGRLLDGRTWDEMPGVRA